ncbi:MAG: flagella synthesis protein FlgN [Gammaproteobacteria bacterium]
MTSDTRALTDEGHLSLDQVVLQALEKATALRAHLTVEKHALVDPNPDALPPVFSRKAELAGELERLETQRRALCEARLGTSHPDESVFRATLSAAGRAAWQRYCEELLACQDANAINGRLTVARQRHVRRALDILRGQPAHEAGLYNALGTTDQRSPNQSLGSA